MVYFTTRFSDQRHLIDEMEEGGYTVETFQQRSLRQLADKQIDKLAYFTAFTEPLPVHAGRDYLPYATEFAMHFLQEKFQSGFILLVEGSQIDFAGHARDVNYMLYEMQDFVEAIEQAIHFAENNGETLVLVTSDHATGELTLREGNPNRRAKLKFLSNKHTSEMVPIFSYGPGSEHFRGIMDNTEIFFKLKELLQF
jgi:alkaline phosphatase